LGLQQSLMTTAVLPSPMPSARPATNKKSKKRPGFTKSFLSRKV
jgi:hypothetical protein